MSENIVMPSVFPVTCHTDFVGKGSTFVVIKGMKTDGLLFIKQAIAKGATCIVIQDDVLLAADVINVCATKGITIKKVRNTRIALAQLSAASAGFPAQKLTMFGVTGTKGKTTTAAVLNHLLNSAGYDTALLSTAFNKIKGTIFKAPLTTAQPDYLHQFLKLCLDNGVTHCVVEVAAQALSLHRIDTLQLDGIIFTNFAREHLEFYSSLESYFDAKKQIFSHAKPNALILVNGDDAWCSTFPTQYIRFGIDNAASAVQGQISNNTGCLQATVRYKQYSVIYTNKILIAKYNLYNCMAAVGMALLYGISDQVCAKALNIFDGIPGRFETYSLQNGSTCIIDSAHNPISFEAILSSVQAMTNHLIVVFGAGGERDAGRRPIMGSIVSHFAHHIILTSDNPRSEDPHAIINNIIEGIQHNDRSKVLIEVDRAIAIQKAYALSKPGSIILLLGKGHEEYQLVGNVKQPFSEKAIIAQWQK
ncbi:UDP-N-acetylmuramoyl-L-alanyl-D-glutamate--2,6-diaminopimelate ligase [Candidatus Dependentiae bacterium]|nr:MAG: UDP-N-acetylmuramoyl-L-alanyl-D-glutamate--2,6-diaminopimelate ligase [Candidatus Dependentiae bacterium]